MLVALAERGCIVPTKNEWEQLYKEHVIATIHTEMLKPLDFELLSIIWSLSIFRRFDQRLLGGLLDRGILPSMPGNKSRQARDLRVKLEEINLFDAEEKISMIATNYAMRHALSLSMKLDAPDRYKMLNRLALEMFLDRLQSSETGLEKKIERTVANLFEILYHSTRLLEIELDEKRLQPAASSVCTKIQDAFENYLLLALTMVQNDNRPAFFKYIKGRWVEDKELQEVIRRITKPKDCLKGLAKLLDIYDTIHGESE
jgi:hypothetical protein